MQLNISGHHVEVTSALRDYVTNKFDRLNRHYDQITRGQSRDQIKNNRYSQAGGEI